MELEKQEKMRNKKKRKRLNREYFVTAAKNALT
jgi:hypothetical protein